MRKSTLTQNVAFLTCSGIGSDGRNLESVGNGATDGGTHSSSLHHNSTADHGGAGHNNNSASHNSLAHSGGGASSHDGNNVHCCKCIV